MDKSFVRQFVWSEHVMKYHYCLKGYTIFGDPEEKFYAFFEQLLNSYTNFCLLTEKENYLGSQSECNVLFAITTYKSCVKLLNEFIE